MSNVSRERKAVWGYNDGKNAATMRNPIHNNWLGVDGILRHYDESYIMGYIIGYKEMTGKVLTILIKEQ